VGRRIRRVGCPNSDDPRRREGRHQVVAAFDTEREFRKSFRELTRDLERRRAEGAPIDAREHYASIILAPGARRREKDARLLRQASRRGVALSEDLVKQLDVPPSAVALRSVARRGRRT